MRTYGYLLALFICKSIIIVFIISIRVSSNSLIFLVVPTTKVYYFFQDLFLCFQEVDWFDVGLRWCCKEILVFFVHKCEIAVFVDRIGFHFDEGENFIPHYPDIWEYDNDNSDDIKISTKMITKEVKI